MLESAVLFPLQFDLNGNAKQNIQSSIGHPGMAALLIISRSVRSMLSNGYSSSLGGIPLKSACDSWREIWLVIWF